MFRTATDPMHAVDMQDFHAANQRRNNLFNRHPPAPGFTPGARSLSSTDPWRSAVILQNLFKKGGPAASALTLSRHCLTIIAGPNELNETVTPDVQALCLETG